MNSNRRQIQAEDPIVVTGVGMVTPIGHDSISAPAAVRAGISRFREIPDFATPSGARVMGSTVYGVTDGRSGSDRLLAMAAPALREALFLAEEYYENLNPQTSRLLVCLGPSDRPRYEDFEREDVEALLEAAQIGLPHSQIEIIREGQAGGIVALAKATALLAASKVESCIVLAADSLVEFPVLQWLDETGRLKTDDRPDGFIPGEAGAAIVLEHLSHALRRGAPILAEVVGPAVTKEEAPIHSGRPLFGKGLTESIHVTLSSAEADLDGIICDLNGEYYRMKEWGLVTTRIFNGSDQIPELWHPAENMGDIGAASAIVFVAIAISAVSKGYFKGGNLLVWCSSDSGARGSIKVKAAQRINQ
jgi:3-oxoacyl-[acyl-carrier-protein] synthase I